MAPKLLFAAPDGTVFEHPRLQALARSGDDLLIPTERPIAMPARSQLVCLPGRRPIGLNPVTKKVEVLDTMRVGGKRFTPQAVAAVLVPGYTRTLLPAAFNEDGPPLTQWAYTAVGWGEKGNVVWALHTDRRNHWSPHRFSTGDLPALVKARLEQNPKNRVLRQLQRCALSYCCFTAQNVFYGRDEGGLPSSTGCNARCLGCISQSRDGGPVSSMERLTEPPSAQELATVGAQHLAKAQGRVMVSFGQGCEGEPLTRWRVLAQAIKLMRSRTTRGSININTNGSRPEAMAQLIDQGLDACRVSMNSAHPDLYHAYYRPVGYGFADVEKTLQLARRRGVYRAVNLLILPGVTDCQGEVEALVQLIVRHKIQQLQARSLSIDADQYVALAKNRGAGGPALGVRQMLRVLRRQAPWLVIGNFARALDERPDRQAK